MSRDLTIFLPYRGEFGHLLMWHAPTVNAHEGKKIVCCEKGQEGLFPNVISHILVNPRPEDIRKTANAHSYDKDLFERIIKNQKKKFPDAKFVTPLGEFKSHSPRKYLVYQPHIKQNINCDVVVCPRKRELAPDRNWEYWSDLTKKMQDNNLAVFAVGSPDASFNVPCKKAWSYDRFFDATLEAILSSKLVICTDSGLAHLAVQCGKPILMITFNGQPGPKTKWKVKWNRYNLENHLNSIIKSVDGWNDIDLVFKTAIQMLNKESIINKEIDPKTLKKALNIGCGNDIKINDQGYQWVNIDARQISTKVEEVDVFSKLPYADNEFDYLNAVDILEHHSYRKTEEVLREWVRVLKHGGNLFIQVPCLTTIIQQFNTKKISEERLIELLYGGQNYPDSDWIFNVHYNCFSESTITLFANKIGLSIVSMKKHGNNLNILLQKS